MRIINNNNSYIDYLRGVAVFFMLWGHSLQYCCDGQFDFFENVLFKFIYSFHMPLFMLISGYLFYHSGLKRGFVELIEYKTKTLLYPILMCSVLNVLLTELPSSILSGRYESIIGVTSLNSLWFLWSVIAGSIALGFAVKVTENKYLQVLLAFLGIGFVAIFPCWDMNVYMYPYFVIGYLVSRNQEKLKRFYNIVGCLSIVIFVSLFPFFRKEHYIYTSSLFGGNSIKSSLKIDIFRWVIGLFGSIAIVWLCQMVFFWLSKKEFKLVEKLGQNSLAVYGLSLSFLSFWLPRIVDIFVTLFTINWNNMIWAYNMIITPIIAIAYSIGLLWIIELMKKCQLYRIVFGR